MTAPTQPPDPRVERIAKALAANKLSLITSVALARVLVEELGGREERKQRTFDEMPPDWKDVVRALDEGMPTWKEQGTAGNAIRAQQRENVETIKAREMHRHAECVSYAELTERNATQERRIIAIHAAIDDALGNGEWRGTTSKEYVVGDAEVIAIRTLAAQQRENAETIAALKERVETAERNAGVADKNYEGLFRASKEMEDDNKRLRAELDAIKGEQVPWAWANKYENAAGCFAYSSEEKARTNAVHKPKHVAIPLYPHPAPAQPVVVLGEVFVFPVAGVKHVSTRWIAPWDSLPEGRYEFTLGAPLPTEGGK